MAWIILAFLAFNTLAIWRIIVNQEELATALEEVNVALVTIGEKIDKVKAEAVSTNNHIADLEALLLAGGAVSTAVAEKLNLLKASAAALTTKIDQADAVVPDPTEPG